jgi:hypothetical protein
VVVYSSGGKWVFPPLLLSFPPTASFTSSSAPDYWAVLLLLPATVFVYSLHGRRVLPPVLWSFPPSTTLTSFPASGCWVRNQHPSEPLHHAQLIYLHFQEGFPSPIFSAQCTPLSFPCVFIVLIAYYSVSLFPRMGFRLSRGLCCSGPGLSVGIWCTTKLTLSASSQAIWVWATGSPGVLLVSPFNVKCRYSVQAGCVEGSKFCLFSVVLIARWVSRVTPRFHYRRQAFCFLPLATILESSLIYCELPSEQIP